MSDDTYEGWANRETWATNLWFANDEGLYNQVREMAQEAISFASDADDASYQLVTMLKQLMDELTDASQSRGDWEGVKPTDELVTMIEDIGSQWRIDWHEIAEHWVADEVAEMESPFIC